MLRSCLSRAYVIFLMFWLVQCFVCTGIIKAHSFHHRSRSPLTWTPNRAHSATSNTAAIVDGSVGAVAVVCLVATIFFVLRARRIKFHPDPHLQPYECLHPADPYRHRPVRNPRIGIDSRLTWAVWRPTSGESQLHPNDIQSDCEVVGARTRSHRAHVLSGSTVTTAAYSGQKGSTAWMITSERTCVMAVVSDHGADLGQVADAPWPERNETVSYLADGE